MYYEADNLSQPCNHWRYYLPRRSDLLWDGLKDIERYCFDLKTTSNGWTSDRESGMQKTVNSKVIILIFYLITVLYTLT